MPPRRRFLSATLSAFSAVLVAAALLAPAATPARAAETPVQVVQALYAAHALAFADKGPSVTDDAGRAGRYFTPAVAKAMAAKELSFDPLYDGQDAKITRFAVSAHPKRKTGADRAYVLVSFRNFGEAVSHTFVLVPVKVGTETVWRIDEIESKNWSLRKLIDLK